MLALSGCANKTEKAYEHAEIAEQMMQGGDLAGARREITRALTYRDDQLDVLLIDGRIKFRMRDFQASYDAYSLALAIDAGNPEALQAVAQLGLSIGRLRESEEATDRILAIDPNQVDAQLIKGIHLLWKRKYGEAQLLGEKILTKNPSSDAGLVLKSRSIFLAGQQGVAMAMLRDGMAKAGKTEMLTTALLECARELTDAPLMLEQLVSLRQNLPKNADLTLDEANVRYKTGDTARGRAAGWVLLQTNGTDDDAMQRLRDIWDEFDGQPLADAQIQSLSKDGRPVARIMVARFYLDKGDPARAKPLVAALQDEDGRGLAARIDYAMGNKQAAGAAAEALLVDDTSNCDALAVRYGVSMDANKPDDAVVAAQQIADQCPDRNDGFLMLADAYLRSDNKPGVRRAFTEGLESRPMNTALVGRYADWLLQSGNSSRAIGIANRLTQRAPAKISGWRLLADVCRRANDGNCASGAASGLARAQRNYAVDLPPGERRPNPLLGHTWR